MPFDSPSVRAARRAALSQANIERVRRESPFGPEKTAAREQKEKEKAEAKLPPPKTEIRRTPRGTYVEVEIATGRTLRYVGSAPLGETRSVIPISEKSKFEYNVVQPEQFKGTTTTFEQQRAIDQGRQPSLQDGIQTAEIQLQEFRQRAKQSEKKEEPYRRTTRVPLKVKEYEEDLTPRSRYVPEYFKPEEPRKSATGKQIAKQIKEILFPFSGPGFEKIKKEVIVPIVTKPKEHPQLVEKGFKKLSENYNYVEKGIQAVVGKVSGRTAQEKKEQEAIALTKEEEKRIKDIETTGAGLIPEFEQKSARIQLMTTLQEKSKVEALNTEYQKKFNKLVAQSKAAVSKPEWDIIDKKYQDATKEYAKKFSIASKEDFITQGIKEEKSLKQLNELQKEYEKKIDVLAESETKKIQSARESRLKEAEKTGFWRGLSILTGDIVAETAFTLTGGSAFKAVAPVDTGASVGRRALYALDTALMFGGFVKGTLKVGKKTAKLGGKVVSRLTPPPIRLAARKGIKVASKAVSKKGKLVKNIVWKSTKPTLTKLKNKVGITKLQQKLAERRLLKAEQKIITALKEGDLKIVEKGKRTVSMITGKGGVKKVSPLAKGAKDRLYYTFKSQLDEFKYLEKIKVKPYTLLSLSDDQARLTSRIISQTGKKAKTKFVSTRFDLTGKVKDGKGLFLGYKTTKGGKKEIAKLVFKGTKSKAVLRPETVLSEQFISVYDDAGKIVKKVSVWDFRPEGSLLGKSVRELGESRLTVSGKKIEFFAKVKGKTQLSLLPDVELAKKKPGLKITRGKTGINEGLVVDVKDILEPRYAQKSIKIAETKLQKAGLKYGDDILVEFKPRPAKPISSITKSRAGLRPDKLWGIDKVLFLDLDTPLKKKTVEFIGTKTAGKIKPASSLFKSAETVFSQEELFGLGVKQVAKRSISRSPKVGIGLAFGSPVFDTVIQPKKISVPKTKISLGKLPKPFTVPEISTKLKPKDIVVPKPAQIPGVVITPKIKSPPTTTSGGGGSYVPPPPIISPPVGVPPIFVMDRLDLRKKKKKIDIFGGKQSKKYTPTVEAAVRGIFSKTKPSKKKVYTGFELRGIIKPKQSKFAKIQRLNI